MKILLSILGITLLAGCATKPGSIAAIPVNTSNYSSWSCSQIEKEQRRIVAELDTLAPLQQEAAKKDFWGVFWLGVPTGSMKGYDKTHEIGRLKGQLDAVNKVAVEKGCKGGAAFDPTGP